MKRAAKEGVTREPTAAEVEGKQALLDYFDKRRGNQTRLAQDTGIDIAVLSKMVNLPTYRITLDAALLIELATEGELNVDVLCPSRAELVADVLFSRLHRGKALRAVK